MFKPTKTLATAVAAGVVAGPVAAETGDLSSPENVSFVINTLFMLVGAFLVMWMAAGFAMLEAGFVRGKNVAMQCTKNVGLFAVASIGFYVIGYPLMYPEGSWLIEGVVGGVGPKALEAVGAAAQPEGDTTVGANFIYQLMFCAATASIVSGTLAERLKLWPFMIFTALLTCVIYPIQASWSWGGGFLDTVFGFKDLAGGTIVHVVGGTAALAGALIVGAREGRFVNGRPVPMPGSNLPLATLGMFILWMGWFGFTAGSHLTIGSVGDAGNVSRIFANTNAAAAGGVLATMLITHFLYGRVDLTLVLNGALAGLVSITAEPLMPSVGMAVMIGAAGGALVVLLVPFLDSLQIDDVVGAIPVHLACGIWGTLAVLLTNPEATIFGQLGGIAIIVGFVFAASLAIWIALHTIIGVRVDIGSEREGLDTTELGQEGYPEFAIQS